LRSWWPACRLAWTLSQSGKAAQHAARCARPPIAGDTVLLFGSPGARRGSARVGKSRARPNHADRGELDVARVFVSRAGVVGTALSRFRFPGGIVAKIVEVRRGDAVLLPVPDLVLEYGDRVGLIATREAIPAARKYFGDSLKSTAEFSYVSVGLGMSLGVLLGLVKVRSRAWARSRSVLPAGRSSSRSSWVPRQERLSLLALPLAANLTLRSFGLTLFLAAVGLGSGAPFVETLSTKGPRSSWWPRRSCSGPSSPSCSLVTMSSAVHDDLFGVVSGTGGNRPSSRMQPIRAERRHRRGLRDHLSLDDHPEIVCAQVAIGLLGDPEMTALRPRPVCRAGRDAFDVFVMAADAAVRAEAFASLMHALRPKPAATGRGARSLDGSTCSKRQATRENGSGRPWRPSSRRPTRPTSSRAPDPRPPGFLLRVWGPAGRPPPAVARRRARSSGARSPPLSHRA